MDSEDIKDIDEILDEAEYAQKAKPTLEADASVNIIGYYRGFRIMTTQRNPNLYMGMYIDRAIQDIDYMIAKGFKPSWADDTNSKNAQISSKDTDETSQDSNSCPHVEFDVKQASGFKNPANKGRSYKACKMCKKFIGWVQ